MNDKDMHNNVDALLGHLSIEKPSVHVVKKSRRRFYNFILLLAACLSIGFCLVMPVWSDKTGLDIIKDWISSNNDPLTPLGDDPPLNNTSAAYHYEHFTPPVDSFGIGETTFKTINWSYWKHWLKENFHWRLQGSPNGNVWYNDTIGLMKVGIDWNEINNTAKVTLTLNTTNAPQSLYYRFELGCNASLKRYINKSSNYEYTFTLPANLTEDYNLSFNFSDVKPLITSGKVTVQYGVRNINGTDYFGFRVQTVDKIDVGKVFVVDPIFGDDTERATNIALAFWTTTPAKYEALRGNPASPGTSGTADYIKIYVKKSDENGEVTCALYDAADDTLVDETEEKLISNVDMAWVQFDFADPKPAVDSEKNYYVCAYGNAPDVDPEATIYYATIGYVSTGGNGHYQYVNNYPTFPNPATWSTNNYIYSMYCSYTEGAANTAPTQSAQKIWNSTTKVEKSLNTTGVDLQPTCFNVTIADTDSDQMNVTIKTNESGTWTTVNATTSGMTDGTYHGYNTSWVDSYNTKYWISFNVSDDTEWCNETYYFWSYNRTNQQLGDYWFLGGNISSNNQLGNFWFLGNNVSNNNQLGDYWFQGGNTSSNNQLGNYWFLGGNETRTNQQLGNYWFLGGNTSNNNQLGDYWFLGGNTTARINEQLGDFWFLGGNETGNNQFGNFWFLGGNETTLLDIYDEYPSNESNVFGLQPTIRFSLINPSGNPMNYTIYTGNSTANCTHYLDNISSVNNGTYHYVNYYNATNYTVDYYWRVYAEDGTQYVNETFHFTPSMQGGQVISSQGVGISIAAAGMMIGVIALVFAISKRKKRSE